MDKSSTYEAETRRFRTLNRQDLDLLFNPDQIQTGAKGLIFFGNQAQNPLDEQTLIYRRDGCGPFPNLLDIPGGGSEPGESPFVTFRRESKEEFGLDIEPEHVDYSRAYPTINGKSTHFLVARLAIHHIETIEFGDEGTSWHIMTLQEYLHRHDVIPVMNERIYDYLGYIAATVRY